MVAAASPAPGRGLGGPHLRLYQGFGRLVIVGEEVETRFPDSAQWIHVSVFGVDERLHDDLTEAGIDMTSPAFWQGGFDVIDEMIDELEELV